MEEELHEKVKPLAMSIEKFWAVSWRIVQINREIHAMEKLINPERTRLT